MSPALAFLGGSLAVPALWFAAPVLASLPTFGRLRRRLTDQWASPAAATGRAAFPRPGLLAASGAGLAGLAVAGPTVALLAAAMGPLAIKRAMAMRAARLGLATELAMPPALRSLADALAAGAPLGSAARELGAPGSDRASDLICRFGRDLVHGSGMSAALARLVADGRSARWAQFAFAIELHHRAGGDLSQTLRSLAAAIDAAVKERDEARASSAQARFTGLLVCALPVLVGVVGVLVDPPAAVGVLESDLSVVLIASAITLQACCWLVIRRLVGRSAGL